MIAYEEEVRRRMAIMQAYLDGMPIEIKGLAPNPDKWFPVSNTQFDNWEEHDYRVKPPEPIKPDSIDWSAVNPRYKFMARDADGDVWLYMNEPVLNKRVESGYWIGAEGDHIDARFFASLEINEGMPWYHSLVARS